MKITTLLLTALSLVSVLVTGCTTVADDLMLGLLKDLEAEANQSP